MRLEGKVALITGAGSGQGRAAALLFAREGARLSVCDIDGDGLADTIAQVEAAGGEILGTTGSVARAADVERIVAATVARFGRLHILYNNAGIYLSGRGDADVTELSEAVWQQVIDTNLKGVFLCAKYAIPEMIKSGGGAIVNIASMAGLRGAVGAHAYSASKGGVIALTYALAASYGRHHIRVNAIAPGPVDTPMIQPARQANPEVLARFLQRVPLGRIGHPEDVAELALFLASDAAGWITGAVFPMDGGARLL